MTASPDERLKIVFDEALRALTQQQARLDNVRSRATTLTAAAALISSFVGPPVLKTQGFTWAPVVAALAVFAVLVCTLAICAPWWRWKFFVNTTNLLAAVDAGHDLDAIHRNLALDFEKWIAANDGKLIRIHWWFTAGLVFLALELAAWSLPLWQAWR